MNLLGFITAAAKHEAYNQRYTFTQKFKMQNIHAEKRRKYYCEQGKKKKKNIARSIE